MLDKRVSRRQFAGSVAGIGGVAALAGAAPVRA